MIDEVYLNAFCTVCGSNSCACVEKEEICLSHLRKWSNSLALAIQKACAAESVQRS